MVKLILNRHSKEDVCNLYDQAYLISGDDVVQTLPIAGRGKLQ